MWRSVSIAVLYSNAVIRSRNNHHGDEKCPGKRAAEAGNDGGEDDNFSFRSGDSYGAGRKQA